MDGDCMVKVEENWGILMIYIHDATLMSHYILIMKFLYIERCCDA